MASGAISSHFFRTGSCVCRRVGTLPEDDRILLQVREMPFALVVQEKYRPCTLGAIVHADGQSTGEKGKVRNGLLVFVSTGSAEIYLNVAIERTTGEYFEWLKFGEAGGTRVSKTGYALL